MSIPTTPHTGSPPEAPLFSRLHEQPRAVAGGPGPLEIVAPQPAGDVYDFPDEIKPGDLARLEGLRGQFTRVDPAPRDFGFAVARGAAGLELPVMKAAGEGRAIPLGEFMDGAVLPMQIQETF